MSLYRDATYRALAGSLCRQTGHSWHGDTCSTCNLRRDDWTSPHSHATATMLAASALPVGHMTATTDLPGGNHRARQDVCANNHDDWRMAANGRFCRTCRSTWMRDRRATA